MRALLSLQSTRAIGSAGVGGEGGEGLVGIVLGTQLTKIGAGSRAGGTFDLC